MRYFLLLLSMCCLVSPIYAELPCGRTCVEDLFNQLLNAKTCGGTKGACRVFVTNEQLRGDLQSSNSLCVGLTGLDAANCVCRLEGRAIDANREFQPWLTDNHINAPKRVGLFSSHLYERVGNTVVSIGSGVNLLSVAQDKSEQGHTHPIRTLINAVSTNNVVVWTGTQAGGSGSGAQCGGNWTSSLGRLTGTVGRAGSNEIGWTDNGTQSCNQWARLYCFEVPQIPTPQRQLTDLRQSESILP